MISSRCLGQTIGHENCSACFNSFSRQVSTSLLLFLGPLCFGGGVNFLIDLSVVPPSPALDEPLYISWTLSPTLPIIYFIYFVSYILFHIFCFEYIVNHLNINTCTLHYISLREIEYSLISLYLHTLYSALKAYKLSTKPPHQECGVTFTQL